MTRQLNQLREFDHINVVVQRDPRLATYDAQCRLVRRFIISRSIRRVIILSRTSPRWNGSSSDLSSQASNSRQIEFCRSFLARLDTQALGIIVTTLQLPRVSAYGRDTLDRLEQLLADQQNVLILSSSIDRVTRRVDHLEVVESWRARNIWVMSFLWDQRRFPYPQNVGDIADYVLDASTNQRPEGTILRELQRQEPLRMPAFGFPVTMPIVASRQLFPLITDVVADAQTFVSESQRTVYANVALPNNLPHQAFLETRGITPALTECWRDWLATAFRLDRAHIHVHTLNSQSSHRCLCREAARPVHNVECDCRCAYCLAARHRLCACQLLGVCQCSVICLCQCPDICHRQPGICHRPIDIRL
jgi:hypothetical protein